MEVSNSNDLNKIIDYINHDKAVILETDTVLGIMSKNLDLLYELKQRPKTKKIVMFVPNIHFIGVNLNPKFIKLTQKFWPGKLTIIYNNVSYRIPNNELILKILNITGPVYCTSANLSGFSHFKDTDEAIETFKDLDQKNELLIIEGKSVDALPSTIYNFNEQKVVREGMISLKDINDAMQGE